VTTNTSSGNNQDGMSGYPSLYPPTFSPLMIQCCICFDYVASDKINEHYIQCSSKQQQSFGVTSTALNYSNNNINNNNNNNNNSFNNNINTNTSTTSGYPSVPLYGASVSGSTSMTNNNNNNYMTNNNMTNSGSNNPFLTQDQMVQQQQQYHQQMLLQQQMQKPNQEHTITTTTTTEVLYGDPSTWSGGDSLYGAEATNTRKSSTEILVVNTPQVKKVPSRKYPIGKVLFQTSCQALSGKNVLVGSGNIFSTHWGFVAKQNGNVINVKIPWQSVVKLAMGWGNPVAGLSFDDNGRAPSSIVLFTRDGKRHTFFNFLSNAIFRKVFDLMREFV